MTPEEIAEKKKAQIESEFKRFKLISEIRARKAKAREQEEAAAKLLKGPDEHEAEEKPPELEIKLAAKARRKFQKIAARGTCTVPMPKVPGKQTVPSKWCVKTNEPAPEIVSRRPENATENPKNSKAGKVENNGEEEEEEEEGEEDEDEDEEEEADDDEAGMDVKNLAQKWDESIAAGEEDGLLGKKKPKKRMAKSAGDKAKDTADGVKIKAKELREHFEQITQMLMLEDVSAERRHELQTELLRMNAEREELDKEEQRQMAVEEKAKKAEPRVAAKHATKMTNKWEKILQKKEKEAKRTTLPPKETRPPSKWTVQTNGTRMVRQEINAESTEMGKCVTGEDEFKEKLKENEENVEKEATQEENNTKENAVMKEAIPQDQDSEGHIEKVICGNEKEADETAGNAELRNDEEVEEEEQLEDEDEWEYEYVDEEEEEEEEEDEEEAMKEDKLKQLNESEVPTAKKSVPPPPPKPKLPTH